VRTRFPLLFSVETMTIYIIRPKDTAVSRSLDLISRKLAARNRKDQVAEVTDLQAADPAQQEIQDWIEDARQDGTIRILKSSQGVTGTRVLDMTDETADQMRADLSEIYVLKDLPLELIQPVKLSAFKREGELVEADLWHLGAIGWQKGLTGFGQGVGVAVLDTGVDASHPALRGKISSAYEFDIQAWEALLKPNSLDTDGHGTHVAGLIVGDRVGVAPEAKLFSGVVTPKGRGNVSTFILALEWVATQPEIQIVNISAGFRGYLPQMDEVIADLLAIGVLPVCATGNDGRDRSCSPGNYRDVISVGASNQKNRVASFSSGGSLSVENHSYTIPNLVAPGEAVYSAVVTGGYEAWNGTSMATPIVSGVAALILEKYPEMTVTDLREELLSRCQDLKQPRDRQGAGLIQVEPVYEPE
jgi:subtilisin family serine protease